MRLDSTGGCKNIVFHKVLGAVCPPWGGILLNYNFCGNGLNFTTFHENGVILHNFQLRGVEMVPGRPRGRNINETYAFPMPF